jgi:hypothetical protein
MFDVLIAAAPQTLFSARVAAALRVARFRVIACELGPTDRPPSVFRVDAAVACAASPAEVGSIASAIRATLDGPPAVVGVTCGAGSPPAGTVDVLRDDAPASLLVVRVQRAAATRERKRSQVLLSGVLAGVGVRELFRSLSARRRTCVLKVQADARHAEIVFDAGHAVHARADGVDSTSPETVVAALASWSGATFEVQGTPQVRAEDESEAVTIRPPLSGDAGDVALGAAVINAIAAYARAFLPSDVVAGNLDLSRTVARAVDPGIGAFTISHDGLVSVSRVTDARTALPAALAAWCAAFFEECARAAPTQFRQGRMSEVLGGLTRLIDQVGWGTSLIRKEVPKS